MISKQQTAKIFTTSAAIIVPSDPPTPISICISAYVNCIFVIVNELGTLGSIIRGIADEHAKIDEEDQYEFQQEQSIKKPKNQESSLVYDCKVLFGSTEIQFYDLVMRRVVELVFEDNKMKVEHNGQKCKVILNISLSKVHTQKFKQNETLYYNAITNKIKQILVEVI